jgi:hypothetical protein
VSGSANITGSLYITNVLEASEKSFNIPHPTQEGKRLIYGVLEGPEHAVYVRGHVTESIIELPEEWAGLVDETTITVQLTPIRKRQPNLYVEDIRDNKIYIKTGMFESINAYYLVQGMRKDVPQLITVR